MEDFIFGKGIRAFDPHEKVKDFIKLNVVIDSELIDFYNEHRNENGKVNLDLRISKKGTYYFTLNTWKPKKQEPQQDIPEEMPEEEINVADIKF
jgi:hypothetical protein